MPTTKYMEQRGRFIKVFDSLSLLSRQYGRCNHRVIRFRLNFLSLANLWKILKLFSVIKCNKNELSS